MDLGPLTAFVGPNASGKSSLLKAAAGQHVANQMSVWRHEPQAKCTIGWLESGKDAPKTIQIANGGQKGSARPGGLYLHLDTRVLRQPIQLQEAKLLSSNGHNLANVFGTLPRRTQEEIAQSLSQLVPVVNDVTLRPQGTGQHRFVFQDRWDERLWYEPSDVSDGTLLVLALLVIQHLPFPLDLVAIEEPEHGLHPFLLGEIVEFLRGVSSGETGPRPIQILIATQSGELLDHLDPSEVRFLTRNETDGSVAIEAADVDSENWKQAYEAHQESLSSLWMSGTAGGVPG